MLNKKTCFTRFFVYCCFVYSSNIFAAISSNAILFVTEHLPPFQIEQYGQIGGVTTEILQAALANTSIEASYKVYPWSRAYNITKQRANTCIYSIARTPVRETQFLWVDVLTQTNSHFIGLSSRDDIRINNLEDAKRYKIAVLKDDVTHELLLNKGFKEFDNLYVVNNTRSLLKLLTIRSNIDLILADNLTITYRALYDNMSPSLFAVYLQVNKNPLNFYLACNLETNKRQIHEMKEAFKAIKHSGQYQEITQRWQQLLPSNKELIR